MDNSLPADLKDMFKLNSDVHNHQTRQPIFPQSIHKLMGSIQLNILFLNYIITHSKIIVLLLTMV